MEEMNKRKRRIIDAAIDTLKENSIEKVSMRKIAEKAGLTTGAIYHFFKNKDELLFNVMKESLHFTTRIHSQVKSHEIKKTGKELVEEINEQVANRIRKTDKQKLHVQFFSDVIKQKCKIREEYRTNYQEIINDTKELFYEGFDILDSDESKAVASILVAAIDGIAMQQALDVLPEDQEKIISTFIAFFNESIPAYLNLHHK
ncbi:MAG: TetR/AcrR family transcriptional regulator [Bacilli bacterium]|nr:TetR/AcrR family transcriptional regulator [Bacilli bacterium]